MLCVSPLFARDYPQNIIGIRGGMNFSTVMSHKLMATIKKDFIFGVSDQIGLFGRYPLYVETGAYISRKGYKINGFHNSETQLWYAQVPVMLNYHLYFNRRVPVYFEPYAGIYYAYGIRGKRTYEDEKINVIKEKEIKHSDLGLVCGIGFSFYYAHIGVKYELGFTDMAGSKAKSPYNQELGYDNLRNRVLSIYMGINF